MGLGWIWGWCLWSRLSYGLFLARSSSIVLGLLVSFSRRCARPDCAVSRWCWILMHLAFPFNCLFLAGLTPSYEVAAYSGCLGCGVLQFRCVLLDQMLPTRSHLIRVSFCLNRESLWVWLSIRLIMPNWSLESILLPGIQFVCGLCGKVDGSLSSGTVMGDLVY